MKPVKSLILLMRRTALGVSLLAGTAHADYAVLDTGEIPKTGQYKFTGTGQVLTENAGLDLSARADMGFNEDFGARAVLGFGKIDLYGGALLKWTPIHDKGDYPALGANAGVLFINDGDYRDIIIRAEPLISKRIKIEETVFTPYASAPIGVRMRNAENAKDKTEIPIQFVVGAQLRLPQVIEQVQFIGEVGLDLNKAPGYIALGAVYYLDSTGESKPAAE